VFSTTCEKMSLAHIAPRENGFEFLQSSPPLNLQRRALAC
jgi:hypothetical protein